jgi:serine/threonine-protein kinase
VLTGERPFTGDSYNSLMVAHTTGLPRDPRQLREDISKALSRVVLTALSRDPSRRFESVREFVHDFRAATGFASEEGPVEPQVGRSTRTTQIDKDADDQDKGAGGGLFGMFRRRRKS